MRCEIMSYRFRTFSVPVKAVIGADWLCQYVNAVFVYIYIRAYSTDLHGNVSCITRVLKMTGRKHGKGIKADAHERTTGFDHNLFDSS